MSKIDTSKLSKDIIEIGKGLSGSEKDLLNTLVKLIYTDDIGDAKDLWSDFIPTSVKKKLIAKNKDIKSLLESVPSYSGIRANKSGRIDFRTIVGKKSKEYIGRVLNVPDELTSDQADVNDSAEMNEMLDRRANQNSSLSESERKQIAKKVAKTSGRTPEVKYVKGREEGTKEYTQI